MLRNDPMERNTLFRGRKEKRLSSQLLRTKRPTPDLIDFSEPTSTESFSNDSFTDSFDFHITCKSSPRGESKSNPLLHNAKKSVRFSIRNNKTYEIDNLKTNKRIRRKIWYNIQELDAIAKRNSASIQQADSRGICYVDSKRNQTMRGLELLLPNDVLTKKRRYFSDKSRKAVLYEQKQQKHLGITDTEQIRALYKANGANRCQQIASNLGLYDERFVVWEMYGNRKSSSSHGSRTRQSYYEQLH